jgi:hypothetical protein
MLPTLYPDRLLSPVGILFLRPGGTTQFSPMTTPWEIEIDVRPLSLWLKQPSHIQYKPFIPAG